MPEFRSAMACCGNISVSRTFIPASKAFIKKASSWQLCKRVSIKPGKPLEIKDNIYKLSKKKPTVKKREAYFPSSKVISGAVPIQHKDNIVEPTLHREG